MQEHSLKWSQCLAVCTDEAASMTGIQSGLIAQIRAMNPDMISNHCMIHRQALAAKNMQPDLHDVLKDVIKVVNFVKSSALNSQMFSKLCENMEAVHRRLLFHSEVRDYLVVKCWREFLSLEKSFRYFSQARLQRMRNSFQTFIGLSSSPTSLIYFSLSIS